MVTPLPRWLLAGPDDDVGRRLAARLGDEAVRVVGAAGAAAALGSAGDAAAAGGSRAAGASGPLPAEPWEAVVYRPLRRGEGGAAGLPDLADAAAFCEAFAAFRATHADAGDHGAAGGQPPRSVPPQTVPPRLVIVASAAAVSPAHDHPGYTAEALRPTGRNPIARAWLDLEALVASRLDSLAPAVERIVLRPAAVAAVDGEDVLCRVLRGRAAAVPAGFDPSIQLLSPDDLAAAIECALRQGAGKPGIYQVAPAGAVPVRAALRLAGVRRLPFAIGGGRLDYLRHGSTVSGAKIARELGFTPAATSAEAIAAELGRRRNGAPPAAAATRPAPPAAMAPTPAPVRPAAAAPAAAAFDPYGQDKRYIAAYGRTLFRFLHDAYWRIEVQGLEHVPRQGRAVLTGVHRGFMPWDGVMALHLIARELGRHPRFLIHPCLVKFPFLANYMTKLGGILACQENADWVLDSDELLGMFPEGIHGAFTMYRDAYRLGKFGRDEYVRMALRQRAPIVPFVTVGSAEIYPILGRIDSKLVRRVAEWPFLPIAPNFPLPGLPLPSKWHTRFLAPLPVAELPGPDAADDPEVVRTISREVRGRMAAAIAEMLARRKSVFFGSVFT